MIIAIDGTAGSGKSTTAREVAQRLGFAYLDTGAMYRAITYKALKTQIGLEDPGAISRMVEETRMEIRMANAERGMQNPESSNQNPVTRIFLDGEDVTLAIRSPEVDQRVSLVSSYPRIREKMVELQRKMVNEIRNGIICEGRDMGTVVFPKAEVKIFLNASLRARAKRRQKELTERGIHLSLQQVEADLARRDRLDSERKVSPLRQAPDAILIDTTDLTVEEEINRVLEIVKKKLNFRIRKQWRWILARWVLNVIFYWLLGARVKGRENIPDTGPLLIASNHLSYLDPPLVGWAVRKREVHYLAMDGLFQWKKGFAWLMRQYNAIPLKTKGFDRKAFRRATGLVKSGEAVVIFPEGARSRIGKFLPPKPGLGLLALQTRAQVIPARIVGSNHSIRALFLRRKRWGIQFGPPLDLQITMSKMKIANIKERFQTVSEEVMGKIAEMQVLNSNH
ncbi:(d)CMP kinase [candidate division TA06 bacterium]|nr:(d)CMP kinase [candidate division TA06 bacterium]